MDDACVALAMNLFLCLTRRLHAPKLLESIHIERQIIVLTLIVGYRIELKVVERNKTIHKLPYFLYLRMENMWAITMYADSVEIFTVDVSTYMVATVYYKTTPTGIGHKPCKSGTIEAGTDNQIVVFPRYGFIVVFFQGYKYLILKDVE